ncbi:hypothetical protein PPTG_21039 [Phytophthora nicotianae INRA-310]|uniref:Uncharacterized protein n=3 Tax=Phytophthora nicotianae TaxID=4792 RepID=W2R8Z4_PHYN3|nr:hypothetical protein PPTG_21039 [Phytophthora nicotianae INRA-310]ETI45682.1 hypothetical protein F443_09824 [Phytophthora nicotianae P1569]ETL39061.1 hypothetical protein L916_09527 [Phytophthora nicotianae]ETM45478.1 hypothetical protein L914_09496 [Phytophthora nicotianae]ETN21000.1 hypothetical protein PPTG_21039 [Phytophthora nicotianae INRA-310]
MSLEIYRLVYPSCYTRHLNNTRLNTPLLTASQYQIL